MTNRRLFRTKAGLATAAIIAGTAIAVPFISSAAETKPGDTKLSDGTATSTQEADETLKEFGTCEELEQEFSPDAEFNRIYDPEARVLMIYTENRGYALDVDDKGCLENNPKSAAQVSSVLQLQDENDLSECKSSVEMLRELDPSLLKDPKATIDNPKGTLYVAPFKQYAEELCERFGIEVP